MLVITHKSYGWTAGLFCLRGKTAAFQSLRDKRNLVAGFFAKKATRLISYAGKAISRLPCPARKIWNTNRAFGVQQKKCGTRSASDGRGEPSRGRDFISAGIRSLFGDSHSAAMRASPLLWGTG